MLQYRCEQERRLSTAHSYRLLNLFSEMLHPLKSKGKSHSPLSHGGHIGYDVCSLGMKLRRCVSNLRFAAINHAKQRSFQCALMCPCAQITDQKVN